MTKAEAPKLEDQPIAEYRGKDVLSTAAIVRNAGDGLSDTLQLAPVIYDSGQLVTLVIRARVGDHTFKYDHETGTYCLVQNFNAGAMVVMDDDDKVAKMLDENESAVAAKKDNAKGTPKLPGTDTGATGRANLSSVPG